MNYDLIVIGAGPGGYVSAIKAAQLGMKVALAEKNSVGGTCLNRGCIPTKSLLHAAEAVRQLKDAARYGIQADGYRVDIGVLYARKEEIVAQLVQGIEGLIKANRIDLLRGEAYLQDKNTVAVNGERYTTEKVLLATGSVPAKPPIPGIDLPGVLTSDDLLAQAKAYGSMIIIGGGVIGVEFATMLQELGCEVTIVEAAGSLLPNFDAEISKKLELFLKKRGIKIHTGATVARILKDEKLQCCFTAKNKEQVAEAEAVLIATGRRAYTGNAVNQELGIEMERGAICVNERFETSVPGVYAIGDVANRGMQLAHMASAQGVNAVLAMNGLPPQYDLSVVPSCVYTSPEIASVGLTEEGAESEGIPVRVGKYMMAGNGKTIISQGAPGFIKVLTHAGTGVILGAQLLCERATDMVQQFAQAIVKGLTAKDVEHVIYPHPTFCEGIGEALENVYGCSIHSLPKK